MLFNRHALLALMEARRVSKSELAVSSQLSASYVTELTKGDKKAPSEKVLRDVAGALEVAPEALSVPTAVIRDWVERNPDLVREWLLVEAVA